jgi:hypothetical protein
MNTFILSAVVTTLIFILDLGFYGICLAPGVGWGNRAQFQATDIKDSTEIEFNRTFIETYTGSFQ